MSAPIINKQIVLSGDVGNFGDGLDHFTAVEVIAALDKMGSRRATIRLNSGGGLATEGVAIASAMRSHAPGVDVIVEGIAASAASLIAVAGTTVNMTPGAVFMIHEPAAMTFGDADQHSRGATGLNTLADSYASIYAAKTGKPASEMRTLMKAETWMTAEETVSFGFADGIMGQATATSVAAFAYARYRHPPASLVAMARAKGWDRQIRNKADRDRSRANMAQQLEAAGVKPVISIPTAGLTGKDLARATMKNQIARG